MNILHISFINFPSLPLASCYRIRNLAAGGTECHCRLLLSSHGPGSGESVSLPVGLRVRVSPGRRSRLSRAAGPAPPSHVDLNLTVTAVTAAGNGAIRLGSPRPECRCWPGAGPRQGPGKPT